MRASLNPQEAYRRVDFDARVAGADPQQLVALCYEQLVTALGSAIYASQAGDNLLKSQSLTRALAALTALQLGIDQSAILAPALNQFFGAARTSLLDNALRFDAQRVKVILGDFADIFAAIPDRD